MKKKTKYNIKKVFKSILNNVNDKYINQIRGDNPSFFTRTRKVTPQLIFLQMVSNTAKSFKNELENFYKNLSLPKNVSTWGFTKQRLKFNPQALVTITRDYLKWFYEKCLFVKTLKGYYIFAIDGSDIVVPSTKENKDRFGVQKNQRKNNPAMAKLSTIYDCLNKMIIDIQIDVIKYAEAKSAEENLMSVRSLFGKGTKKIIIFDRGYPSIKLILNMLEQSEKFLFRLSSKDFKREQKSMRSNDEWINIMFDKTRINPYRADYSFADKLRKLEKIYLRFVQVPITTSDGEIIDEYLLTNLEEDEFGINDLKHMYHLRWNIETSYRMLKSNLKLEDFSGLKSTIVMQDIYMSVFMFNLTQDIILHSINLNKIPQEKYKYSMKVNTNYAIGRIKRDFMIIITDKNEKRGNKLLKELFIMISKNLVPIRNDRSYPRDIKSVNNCRMSYKYSY